MATVEQVYHDAGRALEAASLLETELGTCLLALDALETRSFANPDTEAYRRLLEAMESNTLGRLNTRDQRQAAYHRRCTHLVAGRARGKELSRAQVPSPTTE
jgi:hypothetical protein